MQTLSLNEVKSVSGGYTGPFTYVFEWTVVGAMAGVVWNSLSRFTDYTPEAALMGAIVGFTYSSCYTYASYLDKNLNLK